MASIPPRQRARRILPLLLLTAVAFLGAAIIGPRIMGPSGLAAGVPPNAVAALASGPPEVVASDRPSSPSTASPTPGPTASPTAAPSTASPTPGPTPAPTPGTSPGPSLSSSPLPTEPLLPTEPPLPAEPPSATLARRQALDRRLDDLRGRTGIPGISVAIIFPDGTTWLGQSGLADISAGTPVRADTAFAVASVTKTFTSALILDLVEDGLIRLDEPVLTYLPELAPNIDKAATVRQLLDHTSGLRDFFLHPRIDKALLGATYVRWDAADSLRYVGKPYFRPGRGWHYSNTNYLVLGLLAEAVSGEPLADLYRTRLLVPLGLDDTIYQPAEAGSGRAARGYRFASAKLDEPAIDLSDGTGIVPFTSVISAAAGAGGMASSARDVATFGRSLYTGKVLEPASLAAILGAIDRTERFDPRVPYGLGVQAIEIDGRRTYGHSGRLLGFRSVLRHLPDQGVTIAVLTNQSRTDPAFITRALLRSALLPMDHCLCAARD